MRILYVSHSFPLPHRPLSNVGGMQRVAVALYRTLAQRSDLEVVPLLLETSWKWTGVRTGPFLLRLLIDIPRLARQHSVDAVLFSSMVTAAVTPLLQRRLRSTGVVTAAIPVGRDVTLPNRLYQRWVPKVLESLDLVFPISRATLDECLSRGAAPERVHVIPCGVDPPGKPDAGGEDPRQAVRGLLEQRGIQLRDDSLILLSVGRHQERKGFHWFVREAMPALRDRAIYLVAGTGPMTPVIQQHVHERDLAGQVVLLGQVSDELLQLLYAGSDLFIMPNIPVPGDIEGFGVVMLEAGAAGLPVVAADLEGIRDVIEEGMNGTLVPSGEAVAFTKAIEGYSDPETLREASERARRYVLGRFSWEAVAAEHIHVLRHALAHSRQRHATSASREA